MLLLIVAIPVTVMYCINVLKKSKFVAVNIPLTYASLVVINPTDVMPDTTKSSSTITFPPLLSSIRFPADVSISLLPEIPIRTSFKLAPISTSTELLNIVSSFAVSLLSVA